MHKASHIMSNRTSTEGLDSRALSTTPALDRALAEETATSLQMEPEQVTTWLPEPPLHRVNDPVGWQDFKVNYICETTIGVLQH